MRWKLVKTTIVKSMFIYPCSWARTMSCVVVHLQNTSTLSRQLAQRSTPIPIAIIRPPPIMSHDDDDDDDDSSSRLETHHVLRYKQRRWQRLPPSKSPSVTISMTWVSFLFFFIYSLLMTIFLDYVQLTFSTLAQTTESQGHEARQMHLDPRYFYFVPYFFLY